MCARVCVCERMNKRVYVRVLVRNLPSARWNCLLFNMNVEFHSVYLDCVNLLLL